MSLREILSALVGRAHVHAWSGTAWNPYGIERERKCRCGAFQHRALDFPGPNGPWVDGEDPKATELRAQGRHDSRRI
jgi:hypothetical protein